MSNLTSANIDKLTVTELRREIIQRMMKDQIMVEKRKIAQKKYRQSFKGKIASRRAQKKRYVPTGRKPSRPKKQPMKMSLEGNEGKTEE